MCVCVFVWMELPCVGRILKDCQNLTRSRPYRPAFLLYRKMLKDRWFLCVCTLRTVTHLMDYLNLFRTERNRFYFVLVPPLLKE